MEAIKDKFDLKLKFLKPVTLYKKTPGELRKNKPKPINWTGRLTNILLLLIIGIVVVVFACPEYCGEWSARYDCGYNKIIIKLNNLKYGRNDN